MLKRYLLSSAFAVLCAAVGASAQTAGTSAGQQPQAQQPAAADQAMSKTVEGCVYREQDIPGRSPNVAERAGVLEDYILVADASGSSSAVGTSGSAAGSTPPAGAAPSASLHSKNMFKLEHTADDKLSSMVGKRVRVSGKVDAEAGDSAGAVGTSGADKSAGPDRIELPEFEVTSIEAIEGTCPAKPSNK
jgi:hypothetical protein